jgi:hypothetical protein
LARRLTSPVYLRDRKDCGCAANRLENQKQALPFPSFAGMSRVPLELPPGLFGGAYVAESNQ